MPALTPDERSALEKCLQALQRRKIVHKRSGKLLSQAHVTRIKKRIESVLASDETSEREAARRLKVARETVRKWKKAYSEGGLRALLRDQPRPGRPRISQETEAKVVAELKRFPSKRQYLIAKKFGISTASVSRIATRNTDFWSSLGSGRRFYA